MTENKIVEQLHILYGVSKMKAATALGLGKVSGNDSKIYAGLANKAEANHFITVNKHMLPHVYKVSVGDYEFALCDSQGELVASVTVVPNINGDVAYQNIATEEQKKLWQDAHLPEFVKTYAPENRNQVYKPGMYAHLWSGISARSKSHRGIITEATRTAKFEHELQVQSRHALLDSQVQILGEIFPGAAITGPQNPSWETAAEMVADVNRRKSVAVLPATLLMEALANKMFVNAIVITFTNATAARQRSHFAPVGLNVVRLHGGSCEIIIQKGFEPETEVDPRTGEEFPFSK